MKYNKLTLVTFILVLFLAIIDVSCKKKKTNKLIYEDAKNTNLSFYKSKDTIYAPKGGSPHGSFKLKFNSTACLKLDLTGKLPLNEAFDNGSVIVKEVFEGGELALYAVMKKDSKSKFSANGWLWAEIKPNGEFQYDVSKKGETCIKCHSNEPNRDYTRSFDLH